MAERQAIVDLATALTVAWLGNPHTRVRDDEVPAFLQSMVLAVEALNAPKTVAAPESAEEFTPAVSVRKSLGNPDFIISLIDGKPYKTLRRHLVRHGLTPDTYRDRYGLKSDYPMVAPNYTAMRVELAKKIGLGHMRGNKAIKAVEVAAVAAAEPVKAVAKRARKVMSIVTK